MHIYGIDERSSGVDLVIGQLFTTMRGAVALPLHEIARLISATPETIVHLEAGRIRALPSATEIDRIVRAYGRLAGIDAQPILARIGQQLNARPALRPREPATANTASPHTAPPQSASIASKAYEAPSTQSNDTVDGLARRLLNKSLTEIKQDGRAAAPQSLKSKNNRLRDAIRQAIKPSRAAVGATVLLIGVSLATVAQSGPALYAAVDHLPTGLAKGIRNQLDKMSSRSSPPNAQLRWIETTDPRQRKADRLPQ